MFQSTLNCCAFCLTKSKSIYKCPKCQTFYCSIRCYRSKRHLQCSENFYQTLCEEMEGVEHEAKKINDVETKRPTTTFEEFMKTLQNDPKACLSAEANPQIEINAKEEILFDSDDEPDYLLDVVRASIDQFENTDINELDRRLLTAGISPHIGAKAEANDDNQHVMESLFSLLNTDERKAFTRLANDMLDANQTDQTCFKSKNNSNSKK